MIEAKPRDIRTRTFDFALRIVRLTDDLPTTISSRTIAKQLVRAGTSVGANVEEANAASSKDDFIYKMNIALREARETHYWLRIIRESNLLPKIRLESFCIEAEELTKILGAIVSKSRKNRKP